MRVRPKLYLLRGPGGRGHSDVCVSPRVGRHGTHLFYLILRFVTVDLPILT
jgi:hypothetical protein